MAKTRETTKKTVAKKPITAEKKRVPTDKKSPEIGNEENQDGVAKGKYKGTLLTPNDIARIMKFDISMVSKLKKLGVITPYISNSKKEGDFYKPDVFIYIARYYRELSDSRSSKDTEEMKKAKERQLIARAKKEEFELLEREGELHKADDIVHAVGSALSRLRINLLTIPKGVAPLIVDEKNQNVIAEKIDERIRRALNEVVTLDINKLLAEEG